MLLQNLGRHFCACWWIPAVLRVKSEILPFTIITVSVGDAHLSNSDMRPRAALSSRSLCLAVIPDERGDSTPRLNLRRYRWPNPTGPPQFSIMSVPFNQTPSHPLNPSKLLARSSPSPSGEHPKEPNEKYIPCNFQNSQ